MMNIATISKDDVALWQRIFKRDKTHRAYELFFGNLRQARGSTDLAVSLLLERLAIVTGGDAEVVERMMRQTRLDQSNWDEQRGGTTWIRRRVENAVARMGKVRT